MHSYGYSPAWGVVRTEPQPLPPPPEPPPPPLPEDPPVSGNRHMRGTRWERLRQLSQWRVHDGPEPVPPPGKITAREAAERLGVTRRTLEHYKHDLALIRQGEL
jgi:hypothetical protein